MSMPAPISSFINDYSFRIEMGSRISKRIIRIFSAVPHFLKKSTYVFFNRLSVIADRSCDTIDSYTPEMAQGELKYLKVALRRLRKLVANIEAAEFFHDKELEEKVQSTLDKLYAFEGELRIRAYAGRHSRPTAPDLIESMSEKSKNAIALALHRQK